MPGGSADGFAQGLAHAEADAPPSFDLDRLPGVGIAAEAGLAVLDLERAEARDRHTLVLAQAAEDAAQDRVDETRGAEPRPSKLRATRANQLTLVHRRIERDGKNGSRFEASGAAPHAVPSAHSVISPGAAPGVNYAFFARLPLRLPFRVAFFAAFFFAMRVSFEDLGSRLKNGALSGARSRHRDRPSAKARHSLPANHETFQERSPARRRGDVARKRKQRLAGRCRWSCELARMRMGMRETRR
jgi:hypothetical protein